MNIQAPVLDGVFAINKPVGISSAQCLRNLQKHLDPSKTFEPWLKREQDKLSRESHNQNQKRSRKQRRRPQVKLGHGGTLDPEATGVLAVGVGTGTKQLQKFLECTKSYEAVVTFGAATDTYDRAGKLVKRAAFKHITKEMVEEHLDAFRGHIQQQPPVFSALRIDGKRMYEYAREGKNIPELPKRPVRVDKLEMVEWLEGGSHNNMWPEEEAEKEKKAALEEVLKRENKAVAAPGEDESTDPRDSANKRKRSNGEQQQPKTDSETVEKRLKQDLGPTMSGAIPEDGETRHEKAAASNYVTGDEAANNNHDSLEANDVQTVTATRICPAPAARIRMTVSSGFYVRSLCHDLGIAVGSAGFMASLVRTRQGPFEIGKNVLEYEELDKGEEAWGPQVTELLGQWDDKSVVSEKEESRQESPVPEMAPSRRRRNTSSDLD